jgi:hypothetical protein
MRNFIRRLKSWIASGRTVDNCRFNPKVPFPLRAVEMGDLMKDRFSNRFRSF